VRAKPIEIPHTLVMRLARIVAALALSCAVGCGGTTASERSPEPAETPASSERVCGPPMRGPDCAEDEYCDFELDAICGANDRTGVCRPRPTECPSGGSPVCGCNDQTFPSACEAHRFGVAVQGHGACGPPI